MRTVIIGTPTKLRKVTAKDLPADKVLDFSFWRWVDISGLDLTPYSMENVDVINYRAAGAALPSCHYSQFRFPIDNTGITIPPDVSSYNHDLVVEVFRQASNASDPMIQKIAAYVSGGYDRSWRDGLHHLMQGTTLQDVFSTLGKSLVGYPLLLSRLKSHHDSGAVSAEKEVVQDLTKFNIGAPGDTINLSVPPSFDRWATARMLEMQLQTTHKQSSKSKVWIPQLHPTPIVLIDDRKGEWWQGYEQHG